MKSDEDLMVAVRAGDRDAFATLFARYREAIWRFFRRRTDDRGQAEELTQDTFLTVLQSAERYEPRAAFRSYLFGVAFNLLANRRRKAATERAAPETGRQDDSTSVEARDPVLVIWVRQALAALDPADREVVLLREYDQLSYDDIATIIGVPVGTVRSRLFRARLALKQQLQGHAQPERTRR